MTDHRQVPKPSGKQSVAEKIAGHMIMTILIIGIIAFAFLYMLVGCAPELRVGTQLLR
jgi:hypothetical protein